MPHTSGGFCIFLKMVTDVENPNCANKTKIPNKTGENAVFDLSAVLNVLL